MEKSIVNLKEIASFPTSTIDLSKVNYINYLDTSSITDGVVEHYQKLTKIQDSIPSRARRVAQEDDILFSSVRPANKHYGYLDSIPQNAVFSTGFIVIRVDKSKANPRYVYYYLTRPEIISALQSIAEQSTSAYPAVNSKDFETIKIDLPSRTIQDRLAFFIEQIEQLSLNNIKINDYLIQLQKTIIENYNRTHDCKDRSIYDLVSIRYGSPFKSSMFSDDKGIDLIRIRDLKTDKPQIKTTESIEDMEYVYPGDVLVGMDAEFRPHIWVGREGLLNQRVCKLIPNCDFSSVLAYHYLEDQLLAVESYKTGTTVSHIGKSDFDSMTAMMPSDYDLRKLSEIVNPLHTLYVKNGETIQVLVILRDSLLKKIFDLGK